MAKIGFDYPKEPRKTALFEVEEWYQDFLAKKLGRSYEPVKRNNFGQYAMPVNFLTSVMEEAQAVNKVAVFNIDHMAQIRVRGRDAAKLLQRVLPADIEQMNVGQCKYTLLLTPNGTVIDDMIIMRLGDNEFILVINAGHDITDQVIIDGKEVVMVSDADYIYSFLHDGEEVDITDISDQLVKIDIQGMYSYKVISQLYGQEVLRNRHNPEKNMSFFTFNEFEYQNQRCLLSRTGYTNRWGWEMYFPKAIAEQEFKRIVEIVYPLGGLVVGLGGRDENRISAGNFGLPLYGHEYDKYHTPTNAPLFKAAIDMHKTDFIGKSALDRDLSNRVDKRLVLFISEGIVTGRGIYKDGVRLGSVTSSINSPNIPLDKRLFIESERRGVSEENGIAAIGLGWLYHNPFDTDQEGNDILEKDGKEVKIKVEFYREDNDRKPVGNPVKGYISGNGVNPATAPRALKAIEKL
ncbi:MAG: aminomethyltransferase family protein [Candidatus Cloacimonetes bacterium]|nr:aminomethyltransferase family protein [Candidatus Cloacimonadota bacterium]